MNTSQFTRRDFLRTTTCGAVAGMGVITPAAMGEPQSKSESQPQSKRQQPLLPAGMLGRTRYPVTLVTFGAIHVSEKLGTRLLKMVIDRGVNLVHTSARYAGEKSVRALGELFKADKRYRDRMFLCVTSSPEEKEVDRLLRIMGTDHLDASLTEIHTPDERQLEAIQAQQSKLKKAGKIRYTGFACHSDMNGVMELILDKTPSFFDVTLMSMAMIPVPGNAKSGPAAAKGKRFIENLKALRQKGVGVLAMKSGAATAVTKGGKLFQSHVKSVLEAGADSVVTSIRTFEQVDMIKGLDLKSPHPTPAERKQADNFRKARDNACLMCAECTKACPQNLPINDLMRIRMYHHEYGQHDYARAEYAALGIDTKQLALNCGNCSVCTNVCPVSLASRKTVRQVAALFA